MKRTMQWLCCGALFLSSAAAADVRASASDQSVVATVDGVAITQQEVDALAGSEVHTLKARLYEIRSRALESLINARLIEREARTKGISAQTYARSLVPDRAEVSPDEIARSVALVASNRGSTPADEFEQRVRLELEARERLETYKAAIAALRAKANVAVFLEEPVSPDFLAAAEGGPSLGPADAPVTVLEFADFQCPFCKRTAPVLEQVAEQFGGKVRVVFKHLPLDNSHPRATPAAKAAICADKQQKFWSYHNRLFQSDDLSDATLREHAAAVGLDIGAFEACLSSDWAATVLRQNLEHARNLSVAATPTFLIDGEPVRGAVDTETISRLVAERLSRKATFANRTVGATRPVMGGSR